MCCRSLILPRQMRHSSCSPPLQTPRSKARRTIFYPFLPPFTVRNVNFCRCFTGEAAAHPERKPDASAMAKTIIRRLPAVFLILYLSSFIQSLLLQLSLSVCVMALLLPVIYIALPAAALLAFALTSVSTALVDSYSSVLIASTSLGRVRFMFSLLYSRLLLRGNFIKTVVYYTIICAVSSIIFALPAAGAAALSLSGSPWAVAGWGAAALVQTMLAGISMCIYTGRMLQLEQKKRRRPEAIHLYYGKRRLKRRRGELSPRYPPDLFLIKLKEEASEPLCGQRTLPFVCAGLIRLFIAFYIIPAA